MSVTKRRPVHFMLKPGHVEYELGVLIVLNCLDPNPSGIRTSDILLESRVRQPLSMNVRDRLYNKLGHDKTYNKTCVTSKDSDQPVRPASMARAFVYLSTDSPKTTEAHAISEL